MFSRRVLSAIALTGSLLVAGCQNPDGSTDWGSTLALGAGAGLATALVAGAASDDGPRYRRGSSHYNRGGYYGRPSHSYGYGGRGYGRRGGW
jgi:drug/metabolite transporter (DMT)-like permease